MSNTIYLTQTEIINRGWSKKLVDKFLGEPDKKQKIKYTNKTCYLFLLNRIEEIEKTDNFILEKQKTDKRKSAGLKSARTKAIKLFKEMNEMEIYVDVYRLDYVKNEAIKFFEYRNGPIYEMNQELTDRITVNHIRHNYTSYEENLDRITNKIGKQQAYKVIKIKILNKIAKEYPELSQECHKQLNNC